MNPSMLSNRMLLRQTDCCTPRTNQNAVKDPILLEHRCKTFCRHKCSNTRSDSQCWRLHSDRSTFLASIPTWTFERHKDFKRMCFVVSDRSTFLASIPTWTSERHKDFKHMCFVVFKTTWLQLPIHEGVGTLQQAFLSWGQNYTSVTLTSVLFEFTYGIHGIAIRCILK